MTLKIGDRPLKALILAAGEGTRLRPLTLHMPKPMVPIANRPLLEWIVAGLRDAGVHDLAINLNYKPEAITQHFGDGSRFDIKITYSYEQRLLGSAGAARRLRSWVGPHPLLVVYGDVLSDVDVRELADFHALQRRVHPNLQASLCLYRVSNPTEVGLVRLDRDQRITRFVEKPRLEEVFTDVANAGLCIVEPTVLERIPDEAVYDFGRDVFPSLLEQGDTICGWMLPENAYLIDIGSPEKYERANREWIGRRPEVQTLSG
jgi:NDP-sugar pyrophosphorylase family protein